MSARWQMNRMGFVNFWLYDDEVFNFEEGRLLLRGANASGKSITTQSIIPFVLDGDRTPSRLDSFGSNARKMEYYFLGNNERDESTGYIYLEFKLQGTDLYRTIGIGQRAQQGKPMEFWGFVVLDGRRLGLDLPLYKKVGDKKIPHTRQILKNALGEKNPLVTRQSEYMALVNKYLFGFPHLEQYEQFIKLLVMIRAPKLSRGFKPSDVYLVLNASLPTLSDAELQDMVVAMEKMDDIQAKLESLQVAAKDAQVLRKDYDLYLKCVLAEKGRRYLDCLGQEKEAGTAFEANDLQLVEGRKQLDAREQSVACLTSDLAVLDKKIAVLNIGSLKELADKARQKEQLQQELLKVKQEAETGIKDQEDKIKNYEIDERAARQALDELEVHLDRFLTEVDGVQERLQTPGHTRLQQKLDALLASRQEEERQAGLPGNDLLAGSLAAENELGEAKRLLEREVRGLSKVLEQGRSILQQEENLAQEEARLEEEKDKLEASRLQAQDELERAQGLEDRGRDELLELYYALPEQLKELPVTPELVKQLTGMIMQYKTPSDAEPCRRLLEACQIQRSQQLAELLAAQKIQLDQLRQQKGEQEAELEFLRQQKEPQPKRRESVEAARRLLQQHKVAFKPFYETVEFSEGLSQEQQSLLEAQLTDAGLLDALVVARADYPKALNILKDGADVLLRLPEEEADLFSPFAAAETIRPDKTAGRTGAGCGPSEDLFSFVPDGGKGSGLTALVPADLDKGLRQMVSRFLASAATVKDSTGSLVLAPDGYFRHGLLEGHSMPLEAARFLGRQARLKAQAELIAAKEAELAGLKQNVVSGEAALADLEDRVKVLAQEYAGLPLFGNLDTALELVKNAEQVLDGLVKQLQVGASKLNQVKKDQRQLEQKMLEVTKGLPYSRRLEAYQEAADAADEYLNYLADLNRYTDRYVQEQSKRRRAVEHIALGRERQDDGYQKLRKAEQGLKECSAELEGLRALLANPENQEKVRRYEELTREAVAKRQQQEEDKGEAIRLSTRLQEWQKNVAGLKARLEETRGRLDASRRYFKEEYDSAALTELAAAAPEQATATTIPVAEPLNQTAETATLEQLEAQLTGFAKAAQESVPERWRLKPVGEALTQLVKSFNQGTGNLVSYGVSMEEIFAEDAAGYGFSRQRQKITASWQGQKLELYGFCDTLVAAVGDLKLLIQKKDRELFENILADTVSRKLSYRIGESRKWIQAMSSLMRQMNTSMELTFSLDWKPKKIEGPDELQTEELERLLNLDRSLLKQQDIDRVARHFRAKVHKAREAVEDRGETLNYIDLVRNALDFRQWYEFKMYMHRADAVKKELTDNAFNKFSGGEKALAIYVPLLAAVNAQLQKADDEKHPCLIALDEAFAGVDDYNISSMFALVQQLGFDYLMNSQILWGCYATVKSLRIALLWRPANSEVVSVENYLWNGREKILEK